MFRFIFALSLILGFTSASQAGFIQVHQSGTFDSGSIFSVDYTLDQSNGTASNVIGQYTDWNGVAGNFSGLSQSAQAISTVWWTNYFTFDNGAIFQVSAHQTGLYAYGSAFGHFSGNDNKWNALDSYTAIAASVPEPATIALLVAGIFVLFARRRKQP